MSEDPLIAGASAPLVTDALRSLDYVSTVIFDTEMRVRGLHGGALARHGYVPEKVVGRRAEDVVPASAWELVGPQYARALRGETVTTRMPSSDGTAMYEVTFRPIRRDGAVIGGLAASRDITDELAAEEARAEVERRLEATARDFRLLAESSTDVIVRSDASGEVLYVSPAVRTLHGFGPEDATADVLREAVHPDDLVAVQAMQETIFAGGGPLRTEWRVRGADSAWHWIEVDARGLRDEQTGAVVEMHIAARDVTRRKRGEEIARLWQLSWESTPRGIAIGDTDGNIVAANPAFAAMHGGVPDDFAGEPLAHVLAGPAAAQEVARNETIDREGSLEFESLHRRLDGTTFPVGVEVVALRDDGGEVVQRVAVFTDLTEQHAQRDAERRANELFERSFTEAPVGMLIVRDGLVQRANAALADMLGVDAAALVGRPSISLVHPDDREASAETARRVDAGETLPPTDRRVLHADGTTRIVTLRYSMLSEQGGLPTVLIHVVDRTAERAMEEARRRALSLFESSFAHAPIGLCLVAPDGRFLRVNAALCRLLGRTEDELLRSDLQDLTHPDDLAIDLGLLEETLQGRRDGYEIEKRYLRADGSVIAARLAVSVVTADDGSPEFLISQIVDLTELKRVEAQLKHQADHDALTGLFRRRRLAEAVEQELARMRRHGGTAAVLLLDLDGFKAVNDTLGHSAGDRLLVALARELRRGLRESDVIGRIGGDEFAVLLPDTDRDGALAAAAKLVDVVREHGHVERDGRCASVTVSIGASLVEGDYARDPEALLVEADVAMYRAKAEGRDRVALSEGRG